MCKHCAASELKDFNGEVALYFSGMKGLQKPIAWVFPKLRVCLGCGFVEFEIPETELEQLRTNDFPAGSQAAAC